jgi:hypothetical protein
MRVLVCALVLAAAGCEDRPPPAPDFAGEVTFDLGPPRDLPPPFGLDGNFLPVPDPAGIFVLSVTDESGAPLPARVVFRPPPGEGFGDSLTDPLTPQSPKEGTLKGATVSPGVVGMPEGVLLQTGWGTVAVPPGRYKMLFTRGPEYEAAEVELDVDAGALQAVNVELHRSVDTRGWLAADLHVHAGNSFDSRLPLDRRVISLLANGIEVLVATEHHGIFDFSALLPELGYGPEVAVSLAGDELNFKNGHAGVYPLDPDPTLFRGGSPPYQNLDPATGQCAPPIVGTNCMEAPAAFSLMHGLRKRGTIVTLNHAWFGWSDLGYFTNVRWGAGTTDHYPSPLPIAGSFDAMEVLNGYILHPEAFAYLLADWLLLVSQGYPVTALGSSDAHNLKFVYAGSPRTLLRFPTDRPGDVDADSLRDAILHQRAIATTGPFVTLEVNGGEIGDVVAPRGPGARVHVVADAPMWMALDEVVLFKNGRELRRFAASNSRRPRLDSYLVDELDGDAFYVALAVGNEPLPDDLAGEQTSLDRLPVYPIGLTNPVMVDFEGDGVLRYPAMIGSKLPWLPPGGLGAMSAPMATTPQGLRRPPARPREPDAAAHDHPPLDAMADPYQQLLPLLP